MCDCCIVHWYIVTCFFCSRIRYRKISNSEWIEGERCPEQVLTSKTSLMRTRCHLRPEVTVVWRLWTQRAPSSFWMMKPSIVQQVWIVRPMKRRPWMHGKRRVVWEMAVLTPKTRISQGLRMEWVTKAKQQQRMAAIQRKVYLLYMWKSWRYLILYFLSASSLIHWRNLYSASSRGGLFRGGPNPSMTKYNHLKFREDWGLRKGSREWAEGQREAIPLRRQPLSCKRYILGLLDMFNRNTVH